jgi:multidrug resistance efflux pump
MDQIDPIPYQYAVNQLEAQLRAAKSTVNHSDAGVHVAPATMVVSDCEDCFSALATWHFVAHAERRGRRIRVKT